MCTIFTDFEYPVKKKLKSEIIIFVSNKSLECYG